MSFVVIVADWGLRTSTTKYAINQLLLTKDLQCASRYFAQSLKPANSGIKNGWSTCTLVFHWANCTLLNPIHNYCLVLWVILNFGHRINFWIFQIKKSLGKLLLGIDSKLIDSHFIGLFVSWIMLINLSIILIKDAPSIKFLRRGFKCDLVSLHPDFEQIIGLFWLKMING